MRSCCKITEWMAAPGTSGVNLSASVYIDSVAISSICVYCEPMCTRVVVIR